MDLGQGFAPESGFAIPQVEQILKPGQCQVGETIDKGMSSAGETHPRSAVSQARLIHHSYEWPHKNGAKRSTEEHHMQIRELGRQAVNLLIIHESSSKILTINTISSRNMLCEEKNNTKMVPVHFHKYPAKETVTQTELEIRDWVYSIKC